MTDLAALLQGINVNWYAIPMVAVVSLVYSASQYELPEKILRVAFKRFCYILGVMVIAFGVMWVLSEGL